jgi:hypothetical protein
VCLFKVHNLNPTTGLANVTPLVLHSVEFKADEDSAHGNELIRSDPAGEVIEIPVPYAVIVTVPSIDPIQISEFSHATTCFVEYRFYYKCWCAGLRPPIICTKSSLACNS